MECKKFYSGIAMTFLIVIGIMGQQLAVPDDYSTIQSAINAATEGDTVLVSEGTYYENINYMGKAITVASEFILDGKATHISKTIIDGSKPTNPEAGSVVSIMWVPNSNARLTGFTITGGSGTYLAGFDTYAGGAILILNNGATIEHNIIRDNSVQQPQVISPGIAGAFFSGATMIIRHNKIMRNSSITTNITTGGGIGMIVMSQGVSIKISDNIISDNSLTNTAGISALGGGIEIETEHSYGPDIQINNNTITGNKLHSETSMGGGVYIEFWENVAPDNSNLKVKVFNNLITNNYSQDKGGGLAVFSMGGLTQPTVTYPIVPLVMNNTFIGNRASDGAGVFNYDVNLLLMNNILWDDTREESCREIFQDYLPAVHFRTDLTWPEDTNDGTLYLYNNCIKEGEDELQGTWFGDYNIAEYPMVNPALFKLLPKSPCLGAGTESVQVEGDWYVVPDFDYYNNPRPNVETGLVDIGAVMSDNLRRLGQRNQQRWQTTKESNLKSASSKNLNSDVTDVPVTIDVTPNPLKEVATVTLTNHALITSAVLMDMTGNVVRNYNNINSTNAVIDRAGISGGMYLLKVYADDVYLVKVIIR